ncbi:winged helix-turn-helix transcriptional regulator [Nocardiopsis synnemataformans]|uniref:winged helix-turn-helix domain-containing protein n=1 Tax=Nocardiopsis synnemataformans TaxID=61305 RepID=UPI003EBFCB18
MTAPVERIRAAVEVAQDIQGISGRELLEDPTTTPDPAVAGLRGRLQRRRQRATLRHRHRAARRRERAVDFDAEMVDRGKRALRARQVATSPARRAANLQRLQTAVVIVALPVIIALGSASTSAVHAFMVTYAAASAAVAWAVEPGIITLVSGIIIVRALMRINGATPPGTLAWIERGALASSVVMCAVGSGPGAIVAPVGVAVVALAVERIITGIAAADLGGAEMALLDEGQGAHAEEDHAPNAPRPRVPFPAVWVAVDARRQVRVGGERAEGRLMPGTRALLPVRCAAREQVQDAHARGDAAVAALRGWNADSARTRITPARPDAPTPPRARTPRMQDDQPTPAPARTDAHADAPQEEKGTRPAPVDAWIDAEAARGMRDIEAHVNRGDDDGQGDARPEPEPDAPDAPTGAVRAAKTRGNESRARILAHLQEHPDAKPAEIAEEVGLSASQVRRHLRILTGEQP